MISGHVHLLSILSWGILVYQTSMSFCCTSFYNAGKNSLFNFLESSIMKLATSPCSKIFVSLSLSKPVISFDNRLEAVRLSSLGLADKTGSRVPVDKGIPI